MKVDRTERTPLRFRERAKKLHEHRFGAGTVQRFALRERQRAGRDRHIH